MKLEAILDKVSEGAILLNVEVGKNLTAEIRTMAEEADRIDAIVAQFGEQEVTALRALYDGLEITTRAAS